MIPVSATDSKLTPVADVVQPIPVNRKMKTRLFVGEGNFSYTKALLDKHQHDKPGLINAIIATGYQESVCQCWHDIQRKILTRCTPCTLKDRGVKILSGIDATKLHEHFKGQRFQRIHWNIPHDGTHRPTHTMPTLMSNFFYSCASVQITGDRVYVTLPQPRTGYYVWDFYQACIYNIVSASTGAGYQLIRKRKFTQRYPAYQHTQTVRESSAHIVDGFAREFVFQKVIVKKHLESFLASIKESCFILTMAKAILRDSPKNVNIVSGEWRKKDICADSENSSEVEVRLYFDCKTDDDSSNYSDDESQDAQKVQDEPTHPAASLALPMHTMALSEKKDLVEKDKVLDSTK